jgi:hypothetical protein
MFLLLAFGASSVCGVPGAVAAQRIRFIGGPQPAGPPSGPPPAASGKGGLHIPPGRNVNFTYTLNDGAGHRWDIQYYGTIGQGTNYAYSGGLYLQVNGTNVHSNGRGWLNGDGDEVEIGPYSLSNLRIFRRVRIFRDRGLARWLDIFENPAAQDVTVNLRVYSNTNWMVGNRVFSSGKADFTDKDFAFVTETQGGNAPAVWHYVCGRRSKLRPTVNIQSNQIYVNYSLTVPAGKTVVLCYFESQNQSVGELTKLMKTFQPRKALGDLSPAVRKLLVNMPVSAGIAGVELERTESGDVVYNNSGDPIFGRIANKDFRVETLFGPMALPADQVIGMAAAGGEDGQFRILLAGGQIVAGRIAADARIHMELPSGGTLQVPFADCRQCAYRVSKSRPEEAEFAGPLMVLRTGDRVAFQPESVQLRLRTRHGVVELVAKDLLTILLDNAGNAVHRVTFLNGSRLAGFLEPDQIPLTLKLGPKLTVPRNLVAQVQFAAEEKPDGTLDAVVLSNGDELFGRLAAESLTLKTDYGPVTLRPENIQGMTFSKTHLGRAALQLWDGSVLRGQCSKETLAFQIAPGPTLDIYVGQFVEIRRSQALPPKDVLEKLQRLVGQLGAESYKDRQAATEELIKMGKGIIPMLRKYLTTSDPEVRQRIEDIIERLGGGSSPAPPPPVHPREILLQHGAVRLKNGANVAVQVQN